MFSISPITYPKLIERELTVQSIDESKKIITFNGDFRSFNGKVVEVKIGNQIFKGKYNRATDGIQSFTFDSPIQNITLGTKLTVTDTFVIDTDNQAITIQDIYEKIISEPAENLTESLIGNQGKSGLISGFDKKKLDSLLYDFKRLSKFTVTNNLKDVCFFKLREEINRYRLLLYSEALNGLFEAEMMFAVNSEMNIEYCSVKLLSNVLNNAIDGDSNYFRLKLIKNVYDDNSVFVIPQLCFAKPGVNSKTYEFQVFIGGASIDDFKLTSNVQTSSTPIQLNGSDSEIDCDKTLVSVDSNNIQRISYDSETILRQTTVTDGNIFDLVPGYYLVTNDRKPTDIPSSIVFDNATVTVFKDTDTLLFVSDSQQLFIGKKNSVTKTISWKEVAYSNHKHTGTDIIQDATHRFVTDTEKQAWNSATQSVTNSVWKVPVATNSNLPVNAVMNTIVAVNNHAGYGNKPVILQNVGNNTWVPFNINAFQTDIDDNNSLYPGIPGSLISPELLSKLKSNGIGKSVADGKEQFTSILTESNSYVQSENKFIDINKRISNIEIGDNVISFGFNNTGNISSNSIIFGNTITNTIAPNTITFGTGLDAAFGGIIIGKYNLPVNGNIFSIGNGESDALRSNIFWIDNSNNVTIADGNFKIKDVPETEILTSGGHIPQSSFVSKTDLEQFKDKAVTKEYFTYFKHVPKDSSETIPVIISISQPSNLNYFNKVITETEA